MNVIIALEQLMRLTVLAWIDLRRPSILWPLATLAMLHVVALMMCADPTFSLWAGIMVPLMRLRFGDLFLHYPQSLIGLPTSGTGLRLMVDLLAGPVVAVAVVRTSLGLARGRGAAEFTGHAAPRYVQLLVYFLALTAVWVFLHDRPLRAVLDLTLPYQVRLFVTYGWGFLPCVLMSPFLFLIPALVDRGGNLGSAIRHSVLRFRGTPTLAVLLSFVPYIFGLPFLYAAQRSAILAHQLRPEIVFVLLVLQSLVGVLVSFIVVNAATRLWARPVRAK